MIETTIFPKVTVAGKCLKCNILVHGPLAVRLIKGGIEIGIVQDGESHGIARVELNKLTGETNGKESSEET